MQRRSGDRRYNAAWRYSVLLSAVPSTVSAAARLQPMRRSFTLCSAKVPPELRGRGDGEEVGAVDIVEVEGGTRIGRGVGDLDVAHLEVAHVAEEEAEDGVWPNMPGSG